MRPWSEDSAERDFEDGKDTDRRGDPADEHTEDKQSDLGRRPLNIVLDDGPHAEHRRASSVWGPTNSKSGCDVLGRCGSMIEVSAGPPRAALFGLGVTITCPDEFPIFEVHRRYFGSVSWEITTCRRSEEHTSELQSLT